MFGASSELASVMEFGFYLTKRPFVKWTVTKMRDNKECFKWLQNGWVECGLDAYFTEYHI